MTTSPAVLTEDLIIEVLSFLPVKSLVRFRCVSKSWKTLISDPTFVKLHLEKSQSQTRNSSLLTIITKHKNYIPGNDEEYRVVRHPIDRVFENPSFTFFYDSHSYHLKNPAITRKYSNIVGSCNGLLLLNVDSEWYREDFEYWLFVWNPATRTSFKMRYFHHRDISSFAFGCDNSTGTYKVVAFCNINQQPEVRVLNLGGGGRDGWRNIEGFPVVPFGLDISHTYNYVYLSGTVNWLAIYNIRSLYDIWTSFDDITVEQHIIVSLDLETETYHQYKLPRGFDEVPPREPTIGVLGGYFCFSYSYRETDFFIWQMKEFEVEDSWTQLFKISYHDLLIDYDFNLHRAKFIFQLVPLFLSEDGETLMLHSNEESQTILYNRRDNRAKRTEIIASRTTADNRTSGHVY